MKGIVMTMTLDEVRKTRFHMARRNGYEVTDVDIFVDKVEETLQALTQENETLKARPGSAAPTGSAAMDDLRHTNAQLKDELAKAQAEAASLKDEVDRARQSVVSSAGDDTMRREMDSMRSQLQDARNQAAVAQAQLATAQEALANSAQPDTDMTREIESLRAQLAEARQQVLSSVSQNEYMQLTGENKQLREQVEKMLAPGRDTSGSGMPIVVTTSPEASAAVVRLVQLATEQAESLVSEATLEAARRRQAVEDEMAGSRQEVDSYVSRVKSEADAHATQVKSEAQFAAEELTRKATDSAHQVTTEATTRAEQVEYSARVNAEKLVQEAQVRAATIDQEASSRRKDLFAALETERDTLFAKIEKLRTYEKSYRQTMTGYLKGQIERLNEAVFQPQETPELLAAPARTAQEWAGDSTSSTPRLDALLEG